MTRCAPIRHTAVITAQDRFSTNVSGGTPAASSSTDGIKIQGDFALNIQEINGSTVFVQCRHKDNTTWTDVDSFTTVGRKVGFEPARDMLYRFGVKSGGYVGQVTAEFNQ